MLKTAMEDAKTRLRYRLAKRTPVYNRRITMPRGDRTGPNGMGPMTGRGAGVCGGNANPGFMNAGYGRGMGGGRGGGFGRRCGCGGGRGNRNMVWATGLTGRERAAFNPIQREDLPLPNAPFASPEQSLLALKQQAEDLERSLDALRERIGEIEVTKNPK